MQEDLQLVRGAAAVGGAAAAQTTAIGLQGPRDNDIPGFGSFWCKVNTEHVTASVKEDFCNDERYNFKCQKTCGLCTD